jgi:hypothetical protein
MNFLSTILAAAFELLFAGKSDDSYVYLDDVT